MCVCDCEIERRACLCVRESALVWLMRIAGVTVVPSCSMVLSSALRSCTPNCALTPYVASDITLN